MTLFLLTLSLSMSVRFAKSLTSSSRVRCNALSKPFSSLNARASVCVWVLVVSGSSMKDISTVLTIVSAVVIMF